MERIPDRDDYRNNPHELVAEYCPSCNATLEPRYFKWLHETLYVCGNVHCPDCDSKLKAEKLAQIAEDNEQETE